MSKTSLIMYIAEAENENKTKAAAVLNNKDEFNKLPEKNSGKQTKRFFTQCFTRINSIYGFMCSFIHKNTNLL